MDRARILVVDDDPAMLETTAALLEDCFQVVSTELPRVALKYLERRRFDVLCSDFRMPEMDGLELFSAATAIQPDLRTILVTARQEQYRSQGRHRVLLKPYDSDVLIRMIAHEVRIATMRRAVSETSAISRRLGEREEP